MKKQTWVVIFHFGRGQSQTIRFENKADALESVRVGVFSNEDCINCSIFREDTVIKED